MTTDALRKTYLDFFKAKNHKVFASDSLVPTGDPSLLFTGAGMNQFKPYFLGLKKDLKRATSFQKCLRTADLDRVGKTAYHHTFFEMLGNFSFGDYFKEEAIAWGWEFVTRVLELPSSRLWVSVYQEDDEAFLIWQNKIGLPTSRICRMNALDNFWPANAPTDGPNGPCGPCSEIYVGEKAGTGVEIWNLVFTQFDRQSDGSLINLPQKNIDTGMGLERTAAMLQGVDSNFDIDLFQKIRGELRRLLNKSKRPLQEAEAIAHENAVMDHARAIVFSIADGALPSNEGRGYVIRKLIRLGSEHLEKAGAAVSGTLHQLVPVIVDVMKPAYPELSDRIKSISAIIENEEKSYQEVLKIQVPKLEQELVGALDSQMAEIAFKFYDTFGLPMEVIEGAAQNAGLSLDKKAFNRLLSEQKKRSREKSKITGEIFSKENFYTFVQGLPKTEFLGYESTQGSAKILRIIKGEKIETTLGSKEQGLIIFDSSVFYAESGGQVGDTGLILGTGFRAKVLDAQWLDQCIAHRVEVESGTAKVGETYQLQVDDQRRSDIMKNHTATHLLHSALRKVLGDHVKQSGSLVAPEYLRFDFTHFAAVEPKKLAEVENLVTDEIKKNILLNKSVLSKDQALREGAIAFFGEKYGDKVRVVQMGDFSKELCGGTHLKSTGEVGFFKIVSESSIQAGVRRLEAVTGRWAKDFLESQEKAVDDMAKDLNTDRDHLLEKIGQLNDRIRLLKNQATRLLNQRIQSKINVLLDKAPSISGVKFLVERIPAVDTDSLKFACDYLNSLRIPFAAFLISEGVDKASFAVAGSPELVKKGFHSGKIVKEIAQMVQGSGGGRPEFALGGGKDSKNLTEAVTRGEKLIKEALNS